MIQLQFLNYILNTKDISIIVNNNITDEYFSDYKDEFNFIKDHLDKHGTIPDQVTFLDSFPDFDIIYVNETPEYLLSRLYTDKELRILAEMHNKSREFLKKGDTDTAKTIIREALERVDVSTNIEPIDILRDTSRYEAYVERCEDFDKYYVKTGFPELDEIIGGWDRQEELATIVARSNMGKCLAKGTEVLMADGTFKKVEDIKVGDEVQSYNRVNTVLGLHNGTSKGYKITTSDNESFVVSENHILTCLKRIEKYDKKRKIMTTSGETELVDIMIEDYLKLSSHAKNNMLLFRPSVDYSEKELKIDPYILGCWLGDGTSREAQITTMDLEIVEALNTYCEKNNFELRLLESQKKGRANVYSLKGGFMNLLKDENLRSNKHIPLEYLTSSRQQRLELLAGLLDTDGCYIEVNNEFDFTNKNKALFENVVQLCKSLGLHVTQPKPHIINNCTYYRMNIYGNLKEIPTKVKRKQAVKNAGKNPTQIGFKVEPIDRVEYYGFMCDGDSRYMLSNFILTHNTWLLLKSAVAAVEQGLKVGLYSGEMSERKVGYRIDTLISHIPNVAITKGNIEVANEYKRYLDDLPNRFAGSLKVLTPTMIGGPAGVSALRAFVEKEKLDILFIDQHSLLEDDRKAKSPVEKASNISKDLKNLQVIKKIPIIAVSQQNRTSTEDGVGLEHIAQADRIGQDSTIVIFFEQKEGLGKMHLIKSRDSENYKTITYQVDFNRGLFTYIDDSQEGEEQRLDNMIQDEVTNNEEEVSWT